VRGIRRIGLLLLCGEGRRGKRTEEGQREVVVVMDVFRVGDAFWSIQSFQFEEVGEGTYCNAKA
jgi:hypothetical protein